MCAGQSGPTLCGMGHITDNETTARVNGWDARDAKAKASTASADEWLRAVEQTLRVLRRLAAR